MVALLSQEAPQNEVPDDPEAPLSLVKKTAGKAKSSHVENILAIFNFQFSPYKK